MDLYFLHREEFDSNYNCSLLSDDEWAVQGKPSWIVGGLCLGLGLLYLVLYIPCLIVMKTQELFKHSCFKIMFSLGILDCCSVMYNCILGGYFSLIGAVACPYIVFHYFVGATSIGIWCAQCMMCVVLALNRVSDLCKFELLKSLYEGNRVYSIIALPFLYCIGAIWFGRGCMFSSLGYAYFFDPYFLIDGIKVDGSYYAGYLLSFNNIIVSATLIGLHVFLLTAVWCKARGNSTFQLSKIQRQLCIQAFCVCSLNFLASSIYVYMQFFPTPYFLIILGEFTWQGSTGGAVFIYLTLNRTIRRGVIALLTRRKLNSSTHPLHSHTYAHQESERKISTIHSSHGI